MASPQLPNSSDTPSSQLSSALDRLTQLHPKLIDLGLERTIDLSERMGSPHLSLPPTFHLAGTNGKGSTAALLRALLEAAGYTVHVYSSPHLCRFEERIRLAGRLISEQHLCEILERIEQVNNGRPVTFFESTTVAAFTAFAETPADFLILETGLGGAFDSTNIIPEPLCSIITPIARDHEQFLGTTLPEIASAKAGIIKSGCPAVCATQPDDVMEVLREYAAQTGSGPLISEGKDFSTHPFADTEEFTFRFGTADKRLQRPSMAGDHQIQNAGLALAALAHAGLSLTDRQIAEGLRTAHWPARIQKLETGQLLAQTNRQHFWLDGAHNAHGAAALARSLMAISNRPFLVVFGALNTRPEADFLEVMKPYIHRLYTLTIPDQPASRTASELAQTASQLDIPALPCQSISDAAGKIGRDETLADYEVIFCGSLYLAGEVLKQNGTLPD